MLRGGHPMGSELLLPWSALLELVGVAWVWLLSGNYVGCLAFEDGKESVVKASLLCYVFV